MSDKVHVQGLGLCSWMFLIFMTLKLCSVIDWSWWWVTAPLWGSAAITFTLLALYIVIEVISTLKEGKK